MALVPDMERTRPDFLEALAAVLEQAICQQHRRENIHQHSHDNTLGNLANSDLQQNIIEPLQLEPSIEIDVPIPLRERSKKTGLALPLRYGSSTSFLLSRSRVRRKALDDTQAPGLRMRLQKTVRRRKRR